MKKTINIIAIVSIFFTACSKTGGGGGTPTPAPIAGSKGFIRINFSGKTLEARDTIVGTGTTTQFYPMILGLTVNPAGGGLFNKLVTLSSTTPGFTNGNLYFNFGAFSDSSKTNSPLDTYRFKYFNIGKGYDVKDLSTSTVYPIDTPSSVTVSYSDATYTEGTLNLTLQGSAGAKIPATGSFKVYHK